MAYSESSMVGVAVVGLACRLPGAGNYEEFWANLTAAAEWVSFTASPRAGIDGRGVPDIDQFDASFFGFSPREAELLDPQHRLFLETSWHALEDAGYDPHDYPGVISVYAACGVNMYLSATRFEPGSSAERFLTLISNIPDTMPSRVSYKLNLRGESVAVQTACSSSLMAVHLATRSLLNGDSEMALAGGSSIAIGQNVGYEYQEGMIYSPDGHCRAFDANAQGTVEGDGVAVVVLKRVADALADGDHIYAVIRGTAVNNDGMEKIGYTAPSVSGQAEVVAAALAVSGLDPATISYVETHGTGTALGDPIEVAALTKAYRLYTDRVGYCPIASVKTNVGHLVWSAGIAGLIKTVLAIQRGYRPASINFKDPNPEINFASSPFYVARTGEPWSAAQRRAGVSSFGIGGTNVHVILEQAPPSEPGSPAPGAVVATMSARSAVSLSAMREQLRLWLRDRSSLPVADVAYTLNAGRHAFPVRWAAVVADTAELVEVLGHDPVGADVMRADGTPAPDENAELVELGRAWLSGDGVDWQRVYRGQRRLRVPLPGYRFERQPYWLRPTDNDRRPADGERASGSRLAKQAKVSDWLYQVRWRRTPVPPPYVPGDLARTDGYWLLLGTDDRLGTHVADALRRDARAVLAVPGERFEAIGTDHYRIDATDPHGYELLLAAARIRHGEPTGVVHMWSCHDGIDAALPTESVLFVAQALARRNIQANLWYVARRCSYPLDTDMPDPERAAPVALCRVISQEHPNLTCRSVDLGCASEETDTEALLAELAYPADDVEVAYRVRQRLVPELVQASNIGASPPPLRTGGVYLVLGGLGMLGLSIAQWLVEQARARVVLVGRHGTTSGERAKRLEEVRARGGDVLVRAADIADDHALRALLADVRGRFGRVDGVVHAAGTTDRRTFQPMLDLNPTDVAEILRPRREGTRVLHHVLQDEPAELVLVGSSLSSHLGGLTYAAYAAGNRFMDAQSVAAARAGQPWRVINWDTWKPLPGSQRDFGAGITDVSMEHGEALEALRLAMTTDSQQIVVSATPLKDRVSHVQRALNRRKPSNVSPARATRAGTSSTAVEPDVMAVVADLLSVEQVGLDDDFFSIGGDSLLMVDLMDRVQERLGIQLTLTDVVQTSSIRDLAALCARRAGQGEAGERHSFEFAIDGELAVVTITGGP